MVWILCFALVERLRSLPRSFPAFQLQTVFYQNLFPNGGIQTVYDEDFAFIILGSDPGTLAGAGQLAGNSNHNDSFSGRYSFS